MEPTTKKAKNGEYYGVVVDNGKEVHKTATTSFTRAAALQWAIKWINNFKNQEQKKKLKNAKRALNHFYKNKSNEI